MNNIDALYFRSKTMETWDKQNMIEQLPSPNWSISGNGKDVCLAACLEIFIGHETNRHCPNLFFFYLFLEK